MNDYAEINRFDTNTRLKVIRINDCNVFYSEVQLFFRSVYQLYLPGVILSAT